MTTFDMPRRGTWEERGGWVARRLAADINLTIEQAAGFVGNPGYESGEFKRLQEIKPLVAGSRGGYGWAQWTGDRRRAFEKWCVENRLPPASNEANYRFIVHELLGSYKGFAARLRKAAGVAEACRLTHELYERPQDVLDGSYRSGAARLALARRALAGALAGGGEAAELDDEISNAVKLVQTLLTKRGLYPDKPGWIDGRPQAGTIKALQAWEATR